MRWGLQIFFIHYILFRSSVDIFLTQVTNSSLCTLQFDTSLATLSQAGIRQTGPPRLSWLHGWGCFVKVTWMPSLWRMCCPNWARFLKRCPSLHTNKAWVSDTSGSGQLSSFFAPGFLSLLFSLSPLFFFLLSYHQLNLPSRPIVSPLDSEYLARVHVDVCAIVYVKWWERCKWSVVVGFLCG